MTLQQTHIVVALEDLRGIEGDSLERVHGDQDGTSVRVDVAVAVAFFETVEDDLLVEVG